MRKNDERRKEEAPEPNKKRRKREKEVFPVYLHHGEENCLVLTRKLGDRLKDDGCTLVGV